MSVYYNEFDPFAAAWLRALIKNGLIPEGEVDDRSITEVRPKDLKEFTQCHFFAGIGGWALALKQASWGEQSVWTGSCPCQPFSSAGRQEGIKDERHLWPAFFDLIKECRPPVIFGEQVAAAIGKNWLDIVFSDLEEENYACGATVLSAHSVGGPHIRQRLYWLGNAEHGRPLSQQTKRRRSFRDSSSSLVRLANAASTRLERATGSSVRKQEIDEFYERQGCGKEKQTSCRSSNSGDVGRGCSRKAPRGTGFWKEWEWLSFRDGKRRPVESGTFPLVNGVPNRVGRLRGYGNALCVPTAQEFVKAYMRIK